MIGQIYDENSSNAASRRIKNLYGSLIKTMNKHEAKKRDAIPKQSLGRPSQHTPEKNAVSARAAKRGKASFPESQPQRYPL